MNLTTVKTWIGEQTTIHGLMAIVGGALWGYLHNDWATGGTFIGLGAIGIVLRESPAQVLAQAKSFIGEAQNVRVEAGAIQTEVATVMSSGTATAAPKIVLS